MTLQNYEKARYAMVVSQLQPSGVVSEAVSAAFAEIPREMFVPEALRGVSYLDNDLSIGQGRFLAEPLILGQMVQDAALGEESSVLDVGCATGYASAILSRLAGKVTALEKNEKFLHAAGQHWRDLGCANISGVLGAHQDGYPAAAPYDAIFISGAVAQAPKKLLDQLAAGGKLYCVVRASGKRNGRLTVYTKIAPGQVTERVISDAATPYLDGFEPVPAFHF